jgi:hypothetical protein
MGKMNSQDIKKHIALRASQSPGEIDAQFGPEDGDTPSKAAVVAANWKRMSKRRVGKYARFPEDCWERGFDCKPLDDQLRAYVITDSLDENILSIVIQGE